MDREERVCTWRGSAKVVTNRPTNITAAMGPTEAIVKMPKPTIGSVVNVFRLSEKEPVNELHSRCTFIGVHCVTKRQA
jgi:hypothetical protein